MADKKDSNPFMEMFEKFGGSMNIPQPDLSAIMDEHRKNLAALQEAAAVGNKASQELMSKQRAALEKTLADIADAVQEMQAGGADPAAMMATQMEIAKNSFEATIKNATEMSGVVQQGSTDAFEVLKDRVMDSISEMSKTKKS